MKTLLLAPALLLVCFAATAQTAPVSPAGPVQDKVDVTLLAHKPLVVDAAAVARLQKQANVTVLDVRTPEEFATGHLAGAKNLNFRAPDFAQQVARLDPKRTYVLYCASGNRSNQAATLMLDKGFRDVRNAGGFKTLKDAGLKTE
ncbi:rhodanese-like domain-containing protein [Hymenobacter sp. BT175]|uniref:rhodanese-like domain-containing protein n=1 Tax=Hymenobacter translucens TaxID=2886507 RepID=UPI001D0E3ACE|nr:rhodanese-like domain-containing protein [Hymenobacter translucens]MCC2544985.1 rhodanese-like domain-containing protein [Hymenobacter translucens]